MSISAFRLDASLLRPLKNRSASPDALTRQLPRGLYSTFITNHGGTRVLGLTAHLDRLYLPNATRAPVPSASRADLRAALSSLALSNAPAESRFRILLTESDGTVYVIVQPFTPLSKEVYARGVKVVTAALTRRDPRAKDSGFITESQAARGKVGGDVFEVLLTKKGRILEGMTSNFYALLKDSVCAVPQTSVCDFASVPQTSVCDSAAGGQTEVCRTLVTARMGILLGVTRRAVLRLARGRGMGIQYRPPRLDEEFAEAFLTSSSRGVVPIIQIDGRTVGQGRPGVWTKRLSSAYQAYVEERSESIV